MIPRLPFAAAAIALAAVHAHAATTISSAPIFGGSAAASMLCIVSNLNTDASVDIRSVAVVPDSGGAGLALATNTCGASIATGKSCRFTAAIPQPPGAGYACQVNTTDSATVVLGARLSAMVLDSASNTLLNEPGH